MDNQSRGSGPAPRLVRSVVAGSREHAALEEELRRRGAVEAWENRPRPTARLGVGGGTAARRAWDRLWVADQVPGPRPGTTELVRIPAEGEVEH